MQCYRNYVMNSARCTHLSFNIFLTYILCCTILLNKKSCKCFMWHLWTEQKKQPNDMLIKFYILLIWSKFQLFMLRLFFHIFYDFWWETNKKSSKIMKFFLSSLRVIKHQLRGTCVKSVNGLSVAVNFKVVLFSKLILKLNQKLHQRLKVIHMKAGKITITIFKWTHRGIRNVLAMVMNKAHEFCIFAGTKNYCRRQRALKIIKTLCCFTSDKFYAIISLVRPLLWPLLMSMKMKWFTTSS